MTADSKASEMPREGDILDYELRDEHGKPCAAGLTREQARELKSFAGGYVCKVVVVH